MVGCEGKLVTKHHQMPGVVLGSTALTGMPVFSLCVPVKVEAGVQCLMCFWCTWMLRLREVVVSWQQVSRFLSLLRDQPPSRGW